MKFTSLSHLFFLLTTFSRIVNTSFNLNTSGPDWDYVAKDLAHTTSQACIAAYNADIDCDATLLGLVASMRPAFKPTSADFDNTCTTTCSDSVDAYLKGVQEACTADGDAAQEYVGGPTPEALVPVEIVAQVFHNGTYCYNLVSSSPASSFSCDDQCAIQEYQIAHDYPGSAYQFNYYWLVSIGDWWETEFADGWKRLQQCGEAVEITTSSTTASQTTTLASSIPSSGSTITNSTSNTSIPSSVIDLAESSSTTSTTAAITSKSGAMES
ncbi:hypothetical protein DSL72_009037 [Monilinia vaccinii-corymbosi]|uniref:LysM domain-containing protein n=1 Tax=Monilinia vaccinii-corymbosi TaxID=61207 RepID=A0A8A3PQ59_9HELO|nr:hypothetical protein DSL72_009037 [Monilinia vaccinii-corymbosi]